MKNIKYLFILFFAFLLLGCGDNNDNTPAAGDGLLVHLERALGGVFYEWIDLTYDDDQRLKKIDLQFEGFLEQLYEINYDGTELSSLTHTINNTNTGNITVTEYEIIQEGNEITLKTNEDGDQYLIRISNGYIDYFKAYYGPNNEYFNETVFTRNADNNIEKVEYFATDASVTEFKVYEYTYTNHDGTFDFPNVYNPVMDFSFTTYNPYLGEIMGFKISAQAPLKSSYWDAGGTFREANLIATPLIEDGVLQELSYEDMGTGNTDYLLKLSYN